MTDTGPGFPFVVQEHHEGAQVHWDLMLHRPGVFPAEPVAITVDEDTNVDRDVKVLAAWKLSLPPLPENLQAPISVLALPDHRKIYLTCEGPIRNNRGWCKIFDRGRYELIEHTPDLWRVRFHGTALQGTFLLKKIQPPSGWILKKTDGTD